MWRIGLLLLFNYETLVHSMELKSLNSCQSPLLITSKVVTSSNELTSNTWCPSALDHDRYLLLSLSNLTYLTRFTAKSIVPNVHYQLQYTRDNLLDAYTTWHSYRLLSNQDDPVQLSPPIIAKHVRVQIKHTSSDLCVELEFFGCVFTDGVVSYSMLQGANQLEDDTYDGQYDEKSRRLYDGLGQLSDGQTGPDNHEDVLGLQWVGWRRPRSPRHNQSVGVLFKFDTLRNFSRLTIHANNYFPKKIYVFRSVTIEFLDDHNSSSITYNHPRDDQFEMARPIMIDLQNHVASQLKIHFFFDGHWILISEMTFDSFIAPTETRIATDQQHSPSIFFLIGALTIILLLILTVIIVLVRSMMKNNPKESGCYLTPIHNQTDSSASTASSDLDASSAQHRYATIGPTHPYSLGVNGHLASPSYAKLLPTATLLRSPSFKQYHHIEGVCGNSTYGTQRMFTFDLNQQQCIPSHSLYITERIENRHQILGGGEIYHGNLQLNRSSIPITIRRVLPNVSVQSKISFYNEISLLTSLCHPNIVHAYGFCSEPAISLVTEWFDNSTVDLYRYLQHYKHEQPEESTLYTTTVFFAAQVSSALAYLESLHICHRDVAARNCLVSHDLSVKLSDLAMCNEMYADDYVLVTPGDAQQTRRPIRWCAWETICLNQFTSKSDVFSFGVLLWEMLTLAERPHGLFDDDQVLYNLQHENQALVIPPCAGDLTELISSCWNKQDYDRPAFYQLNQVFSQIQQLLSMKVHNYQQID